MIFAAQCSGFDGAYVWTHPSDAKLANSPLSSSDWVPWWTETGLDRSDKRRRGGAVQACLYNCRVMWSQVAGPSLAAGGDAATDGNKEGAAAGDTHHYPGDHVVDGHEVSGADLEEGAVSGDRGGPSFLGSVGGHNITRGEGAVGAESPDHAGNPPGEARAATTAHDETTAAGAHSGGADGEETANETASAGKDSVDEAPKEPGDHVAVDVGDAVGSDTGGGGSSLSGVEASDASELTVDAVGVGVGERELAEEDHEGNGTGRAGEAAQARDGLDDAAALLNLLEVIHSVFVLRTFKL